MSNRAISTELIELGERIRKRRQEMKLSQESFAEKAGISVNTVSRIEGGQTAMSVEIFRKIIEILETDANLLLGKEGGGTEKQESIQEVLCRIQKMEWKEQKIIMQTIDSLIDSFNEYLAWYQAGRKERYQVEKMQRHGVCSMEELQEKGYDCSFSVVSPEEIVIRLSEIRELEKALGYLTKEDAELITLLFFEEFTVKETAQYFGCCPKTIRNRRKKVLEKLKEQLENT